MHQSQYLYAQSLYYKEPKSKNLVFNTKLQVFARQVGYISCIETNEKVPLLEAYKKLETLWEEWEQNKQQLNISGSQCD